MILEIIRARGEQLDVCHDGLIRMVPAIERVLETPRNELKLLTGSDPSLKAPHCIENLSESAFSHLDQALAESACVLAFLSN